MTKRMFDTTCIGNAIVDVISKADDAFLATENLTKNSMNLIDKARAEELYAKMQSAIEMSGGSAGNTAAGVASLGGKCAYIGKVRDDQLGDIFSHDIRAAGVTFETAKSTNGAATARSLILVTPDAHRTMNTYLGACIELGPEDIDPEIIAASKVTYMEGYLWDPENGKQAFRKAAEISHDAGQRVSLTLSDSFCVDRYRTEFQEFIKGGVDILFANEDEIKSLYETQRFDEALDTVRGQVEIACLTRSEKGSVIVKGSEAHAIPADTDIDVVDTTGAGDLFAAGFLYGLTNGHDLAMSGRIGAMAAAEVISHYGARPTADLKKLLQQKLAVV
ncbi:adenosine kinase [Sneathiella litorea]|uniref:Adenosine kinase n=1 Tax=Sneathiella litorea TaxID=2606216 RepID=A0A6L8W5Z2_9PROT|nr:adenosine kinase [Sneathiella litorea]MZR29902.1 adenosine kinase [Sneathiella litorea]